MPDTHPATSPSALQHLDGASRIAWDFDLTLVGHKAGRVMHDFIRATPHVEHLIVTFRSHGNQALIWHDLAKETDTIGPSHFTGTFNIDDALADATSRLRRQREKLLFAGPETPAERAYRHWKGLVCARNGASILVDDRIEDVEPGCSAFGIVLIHPDAFLASTGKNRIL